MECKLCSQCARAGSLLPLLLALLGCGPSSSSDGDGAADVVGSPLCDTDPDFVVRPDSWTVPTHCPLTEPNYTEVLDPAMVREFRITVQEAHYELTLDDLRLSYANATGDLDAIPSPLTIPATVEYAGHTWEQVGFRWKGNASLKGAWLRGVRKLAFALEFDHFEDFYPELWNQRFFGFRRLNFANAYNDPSLMRDRIAAQVFRDAGVPAARSSYAAVYLDVGDGEGFVYRGLYTIMEEPADTVLGNQIGDATGNLYKPWGEAARWLLPSQLEGVQLEFETCFEKRTNEYPPDWSDVLAAVEALHADRTDAAAWRANLEAVFDVPRFLRALATNQVMMNWDSYGCKHHNYLVYANPLNDGRLQWIPWDLNEAMLLTEASNCRPPGSILLEEIVNGDPADPDSTIDLDWPLIRLILGDETYRAAYVEMVREIANGAFAEAPLVALMRAEHELISPYVIGPIATEVFPYTNTTASRFTQSLTTGANALEPHVAARHAEAEAVLSAL